MAESARKKAGARNSDHWLSGKTTSVPVDDEQSLLDGDYPDAMGRQSDNTDGYEEDTL